ncbi:aldehyde dehydrogenase family protein [Acidothermaceae bacterium B102]|nr:aldehyde dehydrogenase family protein [Acidothermaceae bacterium B102]
MTDLVDIATEREWGLFIGGKSVPALSHDTFRTVSPTTEAEIASVPNGSSADVDAAVTSAEAAFDGWSARTPKQRGNVLRAMAAVLRDNADELAALDAADAGMPYTGMHNDVEWGAEVLEMFGDWTRNLGGQTIPASTEHLHYTTRQPYGVVARIIPFNHPIFFAASKIAAPLAAGNTVVLKPAEVSALSALRMSELFADLLPAGALSVVVGNGPEVGRALVRHPSIRRVGFIGGEATGRAIQRDAADVGVKDVSLELGGKNAMIVCPDADLGRAAASAVAGMNFAVSSGQSCGSTSRLLVHESVAGGVVDEIDRLIAAIRIGDPLDPTTQMGPLATRPQYDKAMGYIAIGSAEGAAIASGGGRPPSWPSDKGFFVQPTVFTGVDPGSRLAQEEVFGPVLSVITWRTEAEAIAIANGVRFGLTGSIWTNDLKRGHRLARDLHTGYIWINGSSRHFWGMPFGGVKSSGIGREESMEELLSYTELKTVNVFLD